MTLNGRTDMIDIKELCKCVDEDAMVSGGMAAGDVMSGEDAVAGTMNSGIVKSKGLRTDDILGKDCDHKKDGYMGKDCFHMPKPLKLSTDGTIRHKKHTPYEKGMKILNDAEIDRDTILAIHKVKEADLRNYILKFFRDDITDAMYVEAIAYFPLTKSFFVKIIDAGKEFEATKYVNLDFVDGKFKVTDDLNIYSTSEIKRQYKDLKNIKCWVVWGGI